MTEPKRIIEAVLMVAEEPLSLKQIAQVFSEDDRPDQKTLKELLKTIEAEYADRSMILKEVASGYRFQIDPEYAPWIKRLWDERPPRYSRALLETLVIIAYRQPVTRAEIENIRGVAVSTNIMRTLSDREWIRVVGHRDVPGKPGIYGTTKEFLDYFNLKNLNELPPLQDIQDIDALTEKLEENANQDLFVNHELQVEEDIHSDSQ